MQSWIKENPITSILSAVVILLVLFSGYQYYQISELHAQSVDEQGNEVDLSVINSSIKELQLQAVCNLIERQKTPSSYAGEYPSVASRALLHLDRLIGDSPYSASFTEASRYAGQRTLEVALCGDNGHNTNNRYTPETREMWAGVVCSQVMSPGFKDYLFNLGDPVTQQRYHRAWFKGCYELEQYQQPKSLY